mgnify:CR=1 FL=1
MLTSSFTNGLTPDLAMHECLNFVWEDHKLLRKLDEEPTSSFMKNTPNASTLTLNYKRGLRKHLLRRIMELDRRAIEKVVFETGKGVGFKVYVTHTSGGPNNLCFNRQNAQNSSRTFT